MRFWWASQGKNYPIAIAQGTLWTCPWFNGRVPSDRRAIQEIERGDIVFHHEHKMIRSVSVAVDEWCQADRPKGYPKKREEDRDVGWLVRVQPIDTGLQITDHAFSRVIAHGSPGPLNKNGVVAQQYLSPLTGTEGGHLLSLAGLELLLGDVVDLDGSAFRGHAPTDVHRVAYARAEQAALRASLFQGADIAPCGLCGDIFPSEMLVAGHILPRALCSEDERWDFASNSMLFCLLGCDALFENRYVTVTDRGIIAPGREIHASAIAHATLPLIGKKCPGYTNSRRAAFVSHAQLARGT